MSKKQSQASDFSEFAPQAAKHNVKPCPLCKHGVASTPFQVGPAVVDVCERCAKPVFHAFGLVEWIAGKIK